MPRANRHIVPGAIRHVTHRCRDRAFLFRLAKDREVHRGKWSGVGPQVSLELQGLMNQKRAVGAS